MGDPASSGGFVRALYQNWSAMFTGPASVLLFFYGLLFTDNADVRAFSWLIAGLCLYAATYQVWQTERVKVLRSRDQIKRLQRTIEGLGNRQKSEVRHLLVRQAREMNELLTRTGVYIPYAHALGINYSMVPEFGREACAVLEHLNYLRSVYYEREVLGEIETNEQLAWAKNLIGPWIAADERRLKVWRHFRETEDVGGRGFVQWIREYLPE